MNFLGLALLTVGGDPEDSLSKKMLPVYVKEAESYFISVESVSKKPLELKKEPVFEWANPTRNDQQGVIFLWLRDGRPAALGCIFSGQERKNPERVITHELHALDPEKLLVKRDAKNQWIPDAGLGRKALADSPAMAATPGARLLQMRRLALEFTGEETDFQGKKWELRLLPTPLYRYPSAKSGVIDGALFAFVSNAGTDPEVLLLIEAREVEGKRRWEYACGRFSDWNLRLQRKDAEVFSSVRSDTNAFAHSPQHLYRIYEDKVVTREGKLLAWIQQDPSPPGGKQPGVKRIRVEDK